VFSGSNRLVSRDYNGVGYTKLLLVFGK